MGILFKLLPKLNTKVEISMDDAGFAPKLVKRKIVPNISQNNKNIDDFLIAISKITLDLVAYC
jgi:hypothetical protein